MSAKKDPLKLGLRGVAKHNHYSFAAPTFMPPLPFLEMDMQASRARVNLTNRRDFEHVRVEELQRQHTMRTLRMFASAMGQPRIRTQRELFSLTARFHRMGVAA
ncbi:hypothetical protein [Bifidobacterium aquikefiricola]|uniref:Uncharacterized protein n=1 Tax=Bifidobacterium aquikefiricola TaxID=3059038 RepID=A0AB39U839_9BIFI